MTYFGVDASHHNGDIDWPRVHREDFRYAFVKFTQGGSFVDPQGAANLAGARKAGLLALPYHFMDARYSVAQQASHIIRHVPKGGVVLDCEPIYDSAGHVVSRPTITQARELTVKLRAAGYRLPIFYTGEYYWRQLGAPSLYGLADGIWKARYLTNTGAASAIYTHVPSSYWDGFGGLKVKILQFTDRASIAGKRMDASAFEGSWADLVTIFTQPTTEDDVSAADVWGYDIKNLAHDPAEPDPAWQILQYAHSHAAAAERVAKQVEDKVDALAAKVDALAAALNKA